MMNGYEQIESGGGERSIMGKIKPKQQATKSLRYQVQSYKINTCRLEVETELVLLSSSAEVFQSRGP